MSIFSFTTLSYDGIVRIFDNRNPQVPLEEISVTGGVWRVKWHPSPARKRDLLAACMHNGFKVLRTGLGIVGNKGAASGEKIIKRFEEHTSLAYGVDWAFESQCKEAEESLVASCSFYDHSLFLWRG